MVLADKKFNIVVALVKMEPQIAAALRTFQIAKKVARLLDNGETLAPCPGF